MYDKSNPSCRCRTPGTPRTKFHMQIVNNYQSLTIATKTHIPGVTERVGPLLNLTVIKKTHLIGNLHVADSLVVSFTKFENAVFRNPVFDLWLEKLNGFIFKVTGRTVTDPTVNGRCCLSSIPNRVNFSLFRFKFISEGVSGFYSFKYPLHYFWI